MLQPPIGRPRHKVEKAILAIEGSRTGDKIVRTLTKLLSEQAEVAPAADIDYSTLRLQLSGIAETFRPPAHQVTLLSRHSR